MNYFFKVVERLLIGPLWNWNYIPCVCTVPLNSLLIGPLWNWNRDRTTAIRKAIKAFNRTIVELKHKKRKGKEPKKTAFNRTIVELKQKTINITHYGKLLLIGPLWNWNSHRQWELLHLLWLLIGPLWNWNICIPNFMTGAQRLLIGPLWNWNCVSSL